jgi:hypothetical protein
MERMTPSKKLIGQQPSMGSYEGAGSNNRRAAFARTGTLGLAVLVAVGSGAVPGCPSPRRTGHSQVPRPTGDSSSEYISVWPLPPPPSSTVNRNRGTAMDSGGVDAGESRDAAVSGTCDLATIFRLNYAMGRCILTDSSRIMHIRRTAETTGNEYVFVSARIRIERGVVNVTEAKAECYRNNHPSCPGGRLSPYDTCIHMTVVPMLERNSGCSATLSGVVIPPG